MSHFLEILKHTAIDTAKLLPFLFLTYLLMEYLEHKAGGALEQRLKKSGRIGPLFGGLFGILPQCGFSAAASGLYSGRIITTGTLIAVYLSTSDEMLPILLSSGASLPLILKLLGVKLILGLAAGFAVDAITSAVRRRHHLSAPEIQVDELCEREKCGCGDHFAWSALRHTVRIVLFILGFSLALNLIIHGVGEERLATLVLDRPILGNLLAALLGLIPNCASSIALTQLYLSGVIPVGAMLSGLLVNSGIGIAILFRNNRPIRDSLRILGILLLVSVAAGVLIDLTPLQGLF